MKTVQQFLDDAERALGYALETLSTQEGSEDVELIEFMVRADLTQLKRTIKTLEAL